MNVRAVLLQVYTYCTKDIDTVQRTAVSASAFAISLFSSSKLGLLVAGSYWLPRLYKAYKGRNDINLQPVFPTGAKGGQQVKIRQFDVTSIEANVGAAKARDIDVRKIQVQGIKGLREFIQWLEGQKDCVVKRFSFDAWVCGQ